MGKKSDAPQRKKIHVFKGLVEGIRTCRIGRMTIGWEGEVFGPAESLRAVNGNEGRELRRERVFGSIREIESDKGLAGEGSGSI